ncbi:hypothetical protein ACROYT_G002047 [Oculina patagonica]
MMTRGKSRVAPAVPSVLGARSQKRAAKSAKPAKVVEGLKVAGILSDATQDTKRNENEDANPAASVQRSVAAAIQDITGERSSPIIDSSSSGSSLNPIIPNP